MTRRCKCGRFIGPRQMNYDGLCENCWVERMCGDDEDWGGLDFDWGGYPESWNDKYAPGYNVGEAREVTNQNVRRMVFP